MGAAGWAGRWAPALGRMAGRLPSCLSCPLMCCGECNEHLPSKRKQIWVITSKKEGAILLNHFHTDPQAFL